MALIRCKECGKEVSRNAAACPNCGAPIKKKGTSLGAGCLTILILTGLGTWIAMKVQDYNQSPEGRAASAKREAARVAEQEAEQHAEERAAKQRAAAQARLKREAQTFSADQVVAYYAANEVAGDQALKGKVFKVKGAVDHVSKDLLNKSYVVVKAGEGPSFRNVQCFFDDSHLDELAPLRPGREVVIFGTCKGLMVNVLMEDCELVTE